MYIVQIYTPYWMIFKSYNYSYINKNIYTYDSNT